MFPVYKALFMLVHLWAVNTACVLFWRIWKVKYNLWWPPADFGLNFFDGRRILGAHKSWLGNLFGCVTGIFFGIIFSSLYWGILFSVGQLTGNFLLSFIKRRLNIPQGAPAPILDQIDYLIGTFIVFLMLGLKVEVDVFLIATIITIPLHIIGNKVIFALNLRHVPW